MRSAKKFYGLLAPIVLLVGCSPGRYEFDTVTFQSQVRATPSPGSTPVLHIDTKVEIKGMFGGTVTTSKPYAICLDYTDETFTFAGMEITHVSAIATDGSEDPGTAVLKLPLHIQARPYEGKNSMQGGAIVTTKSRIIAGEIPGAITRDLPFSLHLEGVFIKDDGSRLPFSIKEDYAPTIDKSTKPWGEVMQGA